MRTFSAVLTVLGVIFLVLAVCSGAPVCVMDGVVFLRHVLARMGFVMFCIGLAGWMLSYAGFSVKCKCKCGKRK